MADGGSLRDCLDLPRYSQRPPELVAAARELHAAGESITRIAALLGVAWGTAFGYVTRETRRRPAAVAPRAPRSRVWVDASPSSAVAVCSRCGQRGVGGSPEAARRALALRCSCGP